MTNIFTNGVSWSSQNFMLQLTGEDCRAIRTFVIGFAIGIYVAVIF